MKNLKKVLALGLALVMLLGMFTVASAASTAKIASDLTDWDTVQHKDAVSLMVDLGIIIGKDDGSFDPTGNIDRASWAKMVYYAATGSDNADAYLGTASGLGDIAGNWAESYISFLKANAYISGDNYGNYNPSNNVTVAEACKMMLTVLGYDAEDRGYQNDAAWSGNIMRDAKRDGLMDNVDSEMTALTPLTRENAAEIVLNTLNANMVEGEPQWDQGIKYIAKYNKTTTLGYDVFNMVKVTAIVDDIDDDGYATITTITGPVVVKDGKTSTWSVQNNITGKVKATSKLIGEEVDIYVKGDSFKWSTDGSGDMSDIGTFKSTISSTAASAGSAPVKTITSGISKWSDVTTRSAGNYVAAAIADTCVFYYNGNKQDGVTKENIETNTALLASMKKKGTVVDFYDNDEGDIDIVKIYEYDVTQITGDATTKTLSDGTLQVRVPGVTGNYVDADKVTGWQGLVEDDVVLFYTTTLGSTKSYTIEKAEKVSGAVTAYNSSGELTLAGSKYKASEQKGVSGGDVTVTEDAFKAWSYDLGDEFDFYLDLGGYLCYGMVVSESADSTKICLVIETEVTDNTLTSSGNLYANLLFADGSTEIVNVSKVNKKTVTNNVNGDTAKKITPDDAQELLAGKKDVDVLKNFFNWKSTSSGYELTAVTESPNTWNINTIDAVGDGSKPVASIWKEGAYAKAVSGADDGDPMISDVSLTANNSTTFIVGKTNKNDDTVVYSVYKGMKNVPEMDTTRIAAVAEKDKTVAKYVYLETGSFRDDTPDGYIFVTSSDWEVDPDLEDTYVVKIIDTDGTYTTMRVNEDVKDDIAGGSDKIKDWDGNEYVGKFVAVDEIDDNGVVTALNNNPTDVPSYYIVDMDDGVISLSTQPKGAGTNVTYDYDNATQFIYVDMDWTDDPSYDSNNTNVRDVDTDKMVVDGYGTFNPKSFYDEDEVSHVATSTLSSANTDGKTYMSVFAYPIVPDNSTTADYIYVVRILW